MELIRSLADISKAVFTNEKLTEKINNGDSVALAMFQLSEAPTPAPRNLMTVANLMTSILIRSGLGDSENDQMARLQKEMAEKIVEVHNNKSPEQNQNMVVKTAGYFEDDGF